VKMPERIPEDLFAPCGMNCLVCYVHLREKNSCDGCVKESPGKPPHCVKCKIAQCVKATGFRYCYECADFSCVTIKNLEKSYVKRYGVSLIENSLEVKKRGLSSFMVTEREKWMCRCDGIISLHDGCCSECGKPQEK